MVSQNRFRFTNEEFNLDLAYITKRVIAMGFPAQGIRSIYRNPLDQVLQFFEKYHQNNVKVYNLCDDGFIDMNQLSFNNGDVKIAYFPMADHNPGPVRLLFMLVLDMALYLCQNQESIVAVHCKAGKGRTGLALCAYLIFMEAVHDTYEAIEFFNLRRTKDGKGLGVCSQKRYLHYFERFLKSTFKPPFIQLLCPYLKNPAQFDQFLKPKNKIKLLSVSIGPFKTSPSNISVKLQLSSFERNDLFKQRKSKSGLQPYNQLTVYNKSSNDYFLLLIFNEEITVLEDIKFKITNQKLQKFAFYYWLNARFVLEGVGKVNFIDLKNKDNLDFSMFVNYERDRNPSYNKYQYEDYEVLNTNMFTYRSDSASTNYTGSEEPKDKKKSLLEDLTSHFKMSINRYEQNSLKKINAKRDIEAFQGIDMSNPLSKRHRRATRRKKPEENKVSEIKLLNNSMNQSPNASSRAIRELLSDSDDDQCNVRDDNEEHYSNVASGGGQRQRNYGGGSFKLTVKAPETPTNQKGTINKIQSLMVNKVTSRKALPTFFQPSPSIITESPSLKSGKQIIQDDTESICSDNDGLSSRAQTIRESNFSAIERKLDKLQQQSRKTVQTSHGPSPFELRKSHKNLDIDSSSVVNMAQETGRANSNIFGIQRPSIAQQRDRMSSLIRSTVNQRQVDQNSLSDQASQHHQQQNESMLTADFNNQSSDEESSSFEETKLVDQLHIPHMRSNVKMSMDITDRITSFYNDKKHSDHKQKSQFGSANSSNISYHEEPKRKLVQVTLTAEELDKFKAKKVYPEIKVMTTFYCDEALDLALFSDQHTKEF